MFINYVDFLQNFSRYIFVILVSIITSCADKLYITISTKPSNSYANSIYLDSPLLHQCFSLYHKCICQYKKTNVGEGRVNKFLELLQLASIHRYMHNTDCLAKYKWFTQLLKVCSLTPHFTYACNKLYTLKAFDKMSMY